MSRSSTWARTRSGSWSAAARAGRSPRSRAGSASSVSAATSRSSGRSRRRSSPRQRSASANSSTTPDAVGAALIDVVVASPGRQARNADQLVRLISRASGAQVRVLTQEEEARLAFEGALEDVDGDGAVAVCDVGGGSAQIAVGTVGGGPAWLRSIDLGSLRLSARVGHGDPPTKSEQAALRAEARAAVSALTPPMPGRAVAVGGSARALRKLVGKSLGPDELDEAMRLLRRVPAEELSRAPRPRRLARACSARRVPRSWPRSSRSCTSRSRWGRPACARASCSGCWTGSPPFRPAAGRSRA